MWAGPPPPHLSMQRGVQLQGLCVLRGSCLLGGVQRRESSILSEGQGKCSQWKTSELDLRERGIIPISVGGAG